VEFFETPAFTRRLSAYLTDDEYAGLQAFLTTNPEADDVMPGTGGFRKLRWCDDRRGRASAEVWLFTLFGKGEADDLTPEQRHRLRAAIDAELQARRMTRLKRGRR
jgi:hypothetical protein